MKRSAEFVYCVAAILFHVALAGWFFSMAVLNFEFAVMRINFILICAVALAGYFINYFMISKGVPAAMFAALQIVMIGLGAFAYVKAVTLEPYVTRTVVISCVAYCTAFPMSAYMAYDGPGKNGMYLRFDILTTMAVVILFIAGFKSVPALGIELAMLGVAMVAVIIALVSERAGRYEYGGGSVQGNAWAGRLVLVVAFAILMLLTGLIAALATGGMESFSQLCVEAIKWCIAAVKAAVLWIYDLLERFFTWLTQFMDVQEIESIDMAPPPPMGEVSGEEAVSQLPAWIKYVLLGLGIAAVGFILFRLRHASIGKAARKPVRRRRVTKRESNASGAFAAMIAGIRDKLLYRFNCLRYKKTAPGLLAWCEKRTGGELSRRSGESGEEFLRRISGSREDSTESEALRSLALLVERAFYSPDAAPVSRELYRQIRKLKFT